MTIQVSYVGHQTIIREVDLTRTQQLDFVMHESNAMINEVVVTGIAGNQLLKDSPTPVAIVSQHDLLNTSSTNIIDAIARRPGMAQVTTGSGISKPVIRGLGYNRIVTETGGSTVGRRARHRTRRAEREHHRGTERSGLARLWFRRHGGRGDFP